MEKRANILVVEEERIVAGNTKRILEGLGYIVPAIVFTGKEAVQEAENLHADLVLMDIVLEGEMTGIRAAEEIRDRFSIPVIYLTSYSDRKTVKSAKETMPYGYLLKPVNEDNLRTTVETALYKHEMERKLEESEQRFKSLFEHHPETVCSFDLEDNFLSVNPAFHKLTGYSVEVMTHMSFKDLIVPEYLPEVINLFRKAREGESQNLESTMLHSEGNRIEVNITGIPIIVNKRIVGIYGIFKDITDHKRPKKDLEQSYGRLQETLEGTINTLASTVELRDPYTAGHQLRVTRLACAIASELDLSEEQLQGVHMASLIHDIGKINVPAEILSKPGKLTEDESNLIKSHSQAGHDILKNVNFPWPIARIVLQHHERMDGSGYPQGLKGEKILLKDHRCG